MKLANNPSPEPTSVENPDLKEIVKDLVYYEHPEICKFVVGFTEISLQNQQIFQQQFSYSKLPEERIQIRPESRSLQIATKTWLQSGEL